MEARISRALLDGLLAEAAASPEREVCGLLLSSPPFALSLSKGRSSSRPSDEGRAALRQAQDERVLCICAIQPAANVSANPADSFEIDPAALFAAIRAERAGGPRVIGHYHSHPHGPAIPSPRDAAAAGEAGRLWLILGDGEAAAWRAMPGGAVAAAFEAVTLAVLPTSGGKAGCAR
jgi:proteasome lid subunit RPN8/RPN11